MPLASPEPSNTPRSKLPEPTSQAPDATPGAESLGSAPYPDAPLCADTGEAHDNSLFHTLWDGVRGCHYDHEHGQNPFGPEVAGTFPDFDLQALIGEVGIGHTNPSGPMENTHKHGGFKWQVTIPSPGGCFLGFEGATVGVDAAVIQYHNFGDYAMEFEARIHSTVALVRQCLPGSADYGYLYTVQHQDYGQRVTPYQGFLLPYPDNFQMTYDTPRGPYFTLDCIGNGIAGCRESRQFILDRNANANSIWTSKPTGRGERPEGSTLFQLLFRVSDNYQVLDSGDLNHPFTFAWLCSEDGGATYTALPGCRYNNSTSHVHEIAGTIPSEWDNKPGFDTDPRAGRITAEAYTDRFGQLDLTCAEPGPSCFPLKLVNAYVGYYGTQLISDKLKQFSPEAQPERDIYFCGEWVCAAGDPGAVASGWIGPNN
jgi:hypothetical protein